MTDDDYKHLHQRGLELLVKISNRPYPKKTWEKDRCELLYWIEQVCGPFALLVSKNRKITEQRDMLIEIAARLASSKPDAKVGFENYRPSYP